MRVNSCAESPWCHWCHWFRPTFKETPAEVGLLTRSRKYLERWGSDYYEVTRSRSFFVNRRGRSSPRTLPMTPNRYLVQSELLPPHITHKPLDTQNSVP